MPIFFNLESHLWIVYLFFVNGFIISNILRVNYAAFAEICRPFEAQVLAAFFISIAVNGVLLLLLSLVGVDFSVALWVLGGISLVGIVSLLNNLQTESFRSLFGVEISQLRLVFYMLVFIVLFYNGAMIDQISDAWWHMVLANKMSLASALSLENGHLNGVSQRYYPPLWHVNLALANHSSGISIPVFWNSFTAWGATLKVMAFYLFAYSLSGKQKIALLSAILFFLLPGVGNSYMRVSAWPSHIAYTGMFSMFYLAIRFFDQPAQFANNGVRQILANIFSCLTPLICLAVVGAIVYFCHQLELLWFACGIFLYYLATVVHGSFCVRHDRVVERNQFPLKLAGTACAGILAVASIWMIVKHLQEDATQADIVLSYALPTLVFIALLISDWRTTGRLGLTNLMRWLWVGIFFAIIVSIDFRQLQSLFIPELAYYNARGHQYTPEVLGLLGGELVLPGWHLQLRHGLLYSGLISIPLSIYLAIKMPSRLSMFTAGGATAVMLCCLSPYLYNWLFDITNYHSPWRISVLLFHPIILATLVQHLLDQLRGQALEYDR